MLDDAIVGKIARVSFVAIPLLLVGCSAIHPSELSQAPAKAIQARLAGHQVLKWYKADDVVVALRFPGAILEDDKARYWVGNGLGLVSYDEKANIWTSFGVEDLKWRVADIQQIAQSAEQTLWIRSTAVLPDNLRFFDGERWKSMARFAESRVLVIFPGAAGKLWFAVGDELLSYEHQEWSRRLKVSALIKDPRIKGVFGINAGLEDRDGFMWLAIRDGIIRLGPLTSNQNNYFGQEDLANGRCIYEDSMARVWVGTDRGSISVYEKSKGSWRSYDLSEHLPLARHEERHISLPLGVNAMLQDKSGQMMIATTRGLLTVDRMENNWQVFTHENSVLPEGSITSMMQDKYGRIWLGTGEGILVLEQ